ncbi:MAG TPA: hypothetical protein VJL84_04710, partial [Kiloniellales bacterium]|nr:hypothetical protein [Kiloniellales bacterium]
ALILWAAARLVEHPRLAAAAFRRTGPRALRWTWAGAGLGAIGMVNMLPLGVFPVLAVDLAVLWLARRPAYRPLLKPWLLHRVITLVLLAPLLYAFLRYVRPFVGHYWFSNSLPRLLSTLEISAGAGVEFDPDFFLGEAGNLALLVLFLLLVALGLLWARRRASLTIVVALAFGSQALLIAVSQHTSLYVVRYFAIATPAMTLLAAVGIAGLLRRSMLAGPAAGTAALALLLLQSLDAMHQLGKPRFDRAVAGLREAGIERLIVHVENNYLPRSVLYYLQDRPQGVQLSPWAAYLAARNGALLWVVDHPWARVDPAWRLLVERGGLRSCRPEVPGVTILAIAGSAEDIAASCPLTAPGQAAATP